VQESVVEARPGVVTMSSYVRLVEMGAVVGFFGFVSWCVFWAVYLSFKLRRGRSPAGAHAP